MAALHHFGGAIGHVVAEVIKPKLVVGAIGNVCGVHFAAFCRRLPRDNAASGHAERAKNATHEVTLVACEEVVHRHNVHALTSDGVEVCGESRDERLTLTGLHLGDVSTVQCGATHELHVKVTEAKGAL